jgi:hypothetical protein
LMNCYVVAAKILFSYFANQRRVYRYTSGAMQGGSPSMLP